MHCNYLIYFRSFCIQIYRRKKDIKSIDTYIEALTGCFIFYKAGRFDKKGEQYLKSGNKYDAADIGLRYYVLGNKKADDGHSLENVVYSELLRRGYEVYVGKTGPQKLILSLLVMRMKNIIRLLTLYGMLMEKFWNESLHR